jgi:hypothetical protein
MKRVLLVLILVILVFCGGQKSEWQGTIEEQSGVTIVKNPKEPMYGPDSFISEEELSIGQADGPEEYIFGYMWQLAVDEKQNVYVIERAGSEYHIRVFDKSGKYIRTIGRIGQGPGEFIQATDFQITPNNELMVHDRFTFKLIFFTLDGDYLRTAFYRGVQAAYVQLNSNGNYFFKALEFQRQKVSNSYYAANKVELFGPDLNFIKLIAKDEYRNVTGPFEPPAMVIRFPSSDSVICGLSETYELQTYDLEGRMVKKVARDFDPVEISDYEKEKRKLMGREGLPKYFRAFQDFFVDEDGRIFVQTYERQTDEDKFYFDVFDPDGKYVAKIPLNTLPKFWKNGKMYTIEEDENGYVYIKRYKVTWNY